ncbi:carbohydrate-binding family 9-like protein [Lunatimonas salinarum]|uniref:carbohydrate-binding family 9-like protein n=1 Tax=Lunatimonas salinarum TaxID=1774590 RepID=UPI001FD85FB4|nr:carbohydrate-binding family 9-like protein [Lunatimonas salinarum]
MNTSPECKESDIANYTCYKTNESIQIASDLTKPVWMKAAKSGRFVDMVTGDPGLYDTRAAALWNDKYLYVAFWAEEPFVSATQTERDSIVFLDNDLELFIDGGDCYYELEINALNTLYEVFFIWRDAYKKGGKFDVPEFDITKETAFTFGGDYDRTGSTFWWGRHPRGTRWAFLDYDMPGLQTAVNVDGKINDNTTVDKGWTAEIAIPWKSLKWLANGRSLPPTNGDCWRMFFGRFQKMVTSGKEIHPHPAWTMNKHGIYDTHLPECFSRVHFTTELLPS